MRRFYFLMESAEGGEIVEIVERQQAWPAHTEMLL